MCILFSKIKSQRLLLLFIFFLFSPSLYFLCLSLSHTHTPSFLPPNYFHVIKSRNAFFFHIYFPLLFSMGTGIKGGQHNSIRSCLNKAKSYKFHERCLLLPPSGNFTDERPEGRPCPPSVIEMAMAQVTESVK